MPRKNPFQRKLEIDLMDEINAFEVEFFDDVISIVFNDEVTEITKETVIIINQRFPASKIVNLFVNQFDRLGIHVENRWVKFGAKL